ncbi:MAG TPA: hotdog domain-containing protein [Alcanivoracaceae bacterium]|nr:hotdog domain-containing protein [Alcanivoracaceae bacterium]
MCERAFQDYYPAEFAHCYGCGRLNDQGHQLKSYWNGDTTLARFTPAPHHTGGVPHNTYGGLIASLLDCHGAATAAAASCRAEGRSLEDLPFVRFVTGTLNVVFHQPTPIDTELEIHGDIEEIGTRKVVVGLRLYAHNTLCASGTMVAVKLRQA